LIGHYKNVMSAVDKITEGLAMSPKRITISTSGIPKMIEKLADENPKFQLAVSLHSAQEKVRNVIMPFSTSFDLDTLLKSLQYWYHKTRSKVTFEYLIWKGINDTQEAIDALVAYAKKVPSKVNIIEYNPTDAGDFQAADQQVIERYKQALERAKITVTVRRSRGKDIDAACGQLANKLVPLEH
jgi:23S rRNA (adenine2503-C2)-methyltransferase